MTRVSVCHELAMPITHTSDASVDYPGGSLVLNLKYCRDGPNYSSGFRFAKVRAFRHKAEVYCSDWEIESSDCTLVEVINSTWAHELSRSSMYGDNDGWILKHFMFYFPESGCYEVIAESWLILEEKLL